MPFSKYTVFFTFSILTIVSFTGLNHVGLFDVDEAIFAQASYEMLESGDYVSPQYNGEPRYHKPPFIYWIQAASMHLLGKTPFAARLPSAIFALLTLLSFFLFLKNLTHNIRFALTSSAVLGICLSFYLVSHAATADMALNFFICVTTFTFITHLYAQNPHPLSPVIGGFLMAAAFLAKGPVAGLVPAVVVGTLLCVKPHMINNYARLGVCRAFCAFVIGVSPWLILMIHAKGWDFFVEFWLVHNWGRFTADMGNTHSSSYGYYLLVLLVGLFPWVIALPSAISWVIKGYWNRLRSTDIMDVLPAIGFIWMAIVVLFFSFSATKLPHYILPAFPGAAMLIAGRLEHLHTASFSRWHIVWVLPLICIVGSVFILLPYAPSLMLGHTENLPALLHTIEITPLTGQKAAPWQQDLSFGFGASLVGSLFIVGTLWGFWAFTRGKHSGSFIWGSSTSAALVLITFTIMPTVYGFIQQPLAHIAKQITPRTPLYMMAIHQPSVRFISGVAFQAIENPEQVRMRPAQVVFKQERLQRFIDIHPTAHLSCNGGYCLAQVP